MTFFCHSFGEHLSGCENKIADLIKIPTEKESASCDRANSAFISSTLNSRFSAMHF